MVELNGMSMGVRFKVYVNPNLVRYVLDDAVSKGLARIVYEDKSILYVEGAAKDVAAALTVGR